MVKSTFDHVRFLLVNGLFLGLGFSFLDKSLFLLFLVLRLVFLEESGQSLELILAKSEGELVDDGRDFKSLEEDFLLSLEKDILGPLDISSKVSLWLDLTTNLVVSRLVLDKFSISRLFEIFLGNFSHRL